MQASFDGGTTRTFAARARGASQSLTRRDRAEHGTATRPRGARRAWLCPGRSSKLIRADESLEAALIGTLQGIEGVYQARVRLAAHGDARV